MVGPRYREDGRSYDEYDARNYAHLVPESLSDVTQPTAAHSSHHSGSGKHSSHGYKVKRKKQHKSKSRKKDEYKRNHEKQLSAVTVKSKSLVDYEDISSDSDTCISADPGHRQRSPAHASISSRQSSGRERHIRGESPATAIRQYLNERSQSNSPALIHEYTPPVRKEKKKKRSHAHRIRAHDNSQDFGEAERLYSTASAPRAYADPPKAYGGGYSYRSPSPVSPKRKYRSPSPVIKRERENSRAKYKYRSRSRSYSPRGYSRTSPYRSPTYRYRSQGNNRKRSRSRSPAKGYSNRSSQDNPNFNASSLAAELIKYRRAREAKNSRSNIPPREKVKVSQQREREREDSPGIQIVRYEPPPPKRATQIENLVDERVSSRRTADSEKVNIVVQVENVQRNDGAVIEERRIGVEPDYISDQDRHSNDKYSSDRHSNSRHSNDRHLDSRPPGDRHIDTSEQLHSLHYEEGERYSDSPARPHSHAGPRLPLPLPNVSPEEEYESDTQESSDSADGRVNSPVRKIRRITDLPMPPIVDELDVDNDVDSESKKKKVPTATLR